MSFVAVTLQRLMELIHFSVLSYVFTFVCNLYLCHSFLSKLPGTLGTFFRAIYFGLTLQTYSCRKIALVENVSVRKIDTAVHEMDDISELMVYISFCKQRYEFWTKKIFLNYSIIFEINLFLTKCNIAKCIVVIIIFYIF